VSHLRFVSPPRSSNWTCRFPASSFPTGFTSHLSAARQYERGVAEARHAHRTRRNSKRSCRAFRIEVFASLSASPSRVIPRLVHARASSACPRLRITKSSVLDAVPPFLNAYGRPYRNFASNVNQITRRLMAEDPAFKPFRVETPVRYLVAAQRRRHLPSLTAPRAFEYPRYRKLSRLPDGEGAGGGAGEKCIQRSG
jgi:hypothetical protein